MNTIRLILPALLSICGTILPGCQMVHGVTCLEQPSSTIDLPNVNPRSLAASDGAAKILVDGWDRNSPVCLVDTASRKVVRLASNRELPLANDEIARDGSLAIFGTGSKVHVYNVSGLPKHLKDVPYAPYKWGARFSPDGKSIALLSEGPKDKDGFEEYSNLDVLDVGSWKRKARLQTQHLDDFLCFSRSGKYLAITCGTLTNIEVWDWQRSKLRGKVALHNYSKMVSDRDSESMVFTQHGKKDGTTVFKRLELPKMAVSTVAEGKFECQELLYADREKVVVEASDDGLLSFKVGTVFISGSKKGTAKWYVSRGFDYLIADVDPTGRYLVVGDPHGKLLLFDLTK